MDIQQFLKNLSTFSKIDFKGKESEMGLLAQKYDKNHNSIFEKAELQNISNDLSVFMNAEGNPDEMSDRELWYFNQSLHSHGKTRIDNDIYEIEKVAGETESLLSNLGSIGEQNKKNIIKKYTDEIGDKRKLYDFEIEELLKYDDETLERACKYLLYIEGRDEQYFVFEMKELLKLNDKEFERAKQLFFVEGREKQLSPRDIERVVKLDDEEFERAKQLFFVEGRKGQFEGWDIIYLSELSDEKFEKAKQFFHVEGREEEFDSFGIHSLVRLSDEELERAKTLYQVEGREKEFSGSDIADLAKLSDEELEKAKKFFHVEGRKEQFNGWGICQLIKLSDEELERAKTLYQVEGREKEFSGSDIADLAKLSDKELERAKTLFHVEGRKEQFSGSDIAELAKLSDEELERAKALFFVEGRASQFGGWEIPRLAKLSAKEFEKAKTLFNVEGRKEQFCGSELADLAKLSDEELERAKTLFNTKRENEELSGWDIARLAKLSDEELERAKTLFKVEGREEQFSSYEIVDLAKLSEEEFELASKYFNAENFNVSAYIKIAKNYSNELQKFMDENPDCYIAYTAGDSVKFMKLEGGYVTYDKTGLIETVDELDIDDIKGMELCSKKTINNTKIKVKQEQVSGYIEDTFNVVVISDTYTFYDDKGKVVKKIKVKCDPKTGLMNVSETDKNGKQKPIQWQSVDPNTGATITQRDITSPEGARTEYYAEENENLKITDYKITDKDGNELINVHQTFEQVSENKFITSTNATGRDEDTQIYEIEYKDNFVVKIYDKKNNRTTLRDLKKFFTNKESLEKLLPTIKRLPGHVLLELSENPIHIDYGVDNEENGFWNTSESLLQVGNYEATTNENDNMLATLTHELGHYVDLYKTSEGKISSNKEIIAIYEEEFKLFQESATTIQQEYINYFTNLQGDTRGNEEKVAETHALLNSVNDPQLETRRFYLAKYFPRTIAAIMKLLLKEEGVM